MARRRYHTCMFGLYSFHLRTKNVPKFAHKLCINTANKVNFSVYCKNISHVKHHQ